MIFPTLFENNYNLAKMVVVIYLFAKTKNIFNNSNQSPPCRYQQCCVVKARVQLYRKKSQPHIITYVRLCSKIQHNQGYRQRTWRWLRWSGKPPRSTEVQRSQCTRHSLSHLMQESEIQLFFQRICSGPLPHILTKIYFLHYSLLSKPLFDI